ncbi:MAG: hypothetical protein AAGA60_02340 [Cyanobacteria bacterium P01_E01_bin.42]
MTLHPIDNKPIKIEIANTNTVYLPILEQELGFSFVFLYIDIKVLNQTDLTIYLDPHYTFLSEFHSAENKYIEKHSTIFNSNEIEPDQNKGIVSLQEIFFRITSIFTKNEIVSELETIDRDIFDYIKISPKSSQNMRFGLRPLFHQNIFSLALPTTSEYFLSSQDTRQFCVFEDLGSGEYSMKLVYAPTRSQKSEKLKEKNENIIDCDEDINSSSIQINLIKPTKGEPHILPTPDIKFEIFIDGGNDVKLSKITKQINLLDFLISRFPRFNSHPKPYIFLPLCFRIINQSLKSYRFDLYNFAPPNFISDGTVIDWEVITSPLRMLNGKSEDYPILMPNKSIDFYPNLVIFLSGWNQFRFSLFSRNGCHLISEPIKPGQYCVCFNYQNQIQNTHAYNLQARTVQPLSDFWIGAVSTPFININLFPP